jgi:hypothetical protein
VLKNINMQKVDTAELRRLWEAATKGMNWQEEVAFSEACKASIPALLDELEAARAELEALKVPLAIYERHTKAIGAAEELKLLIGNWRNMRLEDYLPRRAAKLRQEAEGK